MARRQRTQPENRQESRQESSQESRRKRRRKAVRSATKAPLFRLGRLLLGGVLAFMAVDNFQQMEERVGYAESKGVPMADIAVPGSSALLLAGSVGITLWKYPVAAATAIASFFVGVTPVMHDFWAQDDPQQKQQETFHFMKNAALLGATLALLALGRKSK